MLDMATFAMPKSIELDEEASSDEYGRFVIEPLEKGFGNTLGNSLRRVLLSSLEGVSITSIQIDDVPHEFGSIPNVIEDVTAIVLNFKKVLFQCSGDLPRKLELRAQDGGDITAADIETDGVTEVLNPEQHICTLDKKQNFRVELEIDRDRKSVV